MVLNYTSYSTKHILEQSRNIRFALGNMVYSFNNTAEINLELILDAQQVFIQADVFARQVLLHRSLFDLKRFLGSYQEEWQRLLMEAYVYDRLKAIYYGVNYPGLLNWPEGLVSFPGNILLSRYIASKSFNFHTNDNQPYALYISTSYNTDLDEMFKEVFEICPNLKEGLSDNPKFISYVNSQSETILRGLYNGSIYLESKSEKKSNNNKEGNNKKENKVKSDSLFTMFDFSTDKLDDKMYQDEFPFANGIMNKSFKSWYFYIPDDKSGVNTLHFNESIFLGRAIGLTMPNNLNVSSNPMYIEVPREYYSDAFCKEEVYSVTGLKSELIPYSMENIIQYLSIDVRKLQNMRDDKFFTP